MQIVCFLTAHDSDDEGTVGCHLDIVGRLELTVTHMVFLHSHKGGIVVCLGVAVPIAHDGQMISVCSKSFDSFLEMFVGPLFRCLTMTDSVDELNSVPAADVSDLVELVFHNALHILQSAAFRQLELCTHFF